MKRFAGALMYVLLEVCGMNDEFLLCPVSVKDGESLMNEILMAGNFGHNDPRMGAIASTGGYFGARVSQDWRRYKRNMRFVRSYPGEVIWEPIVRVEHFVWKKLRLRDRGTGYCLAHKSGINEGLFQCYQDKKWQLRAARGSFLKISSFI